MAGGIASVLLYVVVQRELSLVLLKLSTPCPSGMLRVSTKSRREGGGRSSRIVVR